MEGYGNENPGAFQPTRPLRGATKKLKGDSDDGNISTHAPLAGRDEKAERRQRRWKHFNPRAPCGARREVKNEKIRERYFNPRAPCGARLPRLQLCRRAGQISTHAPLAGHDDRSVGVLLGVVVFQPTRPLRGTTFSRSGLYRETAISTHAPLAGHDSSEARLCRPSRISTHAPLAGHDWRPDSSATEFRNNFNPRAPCGARLQVSRPFSFPYPFQPTRPLRGATDDLLADAVPNEISTHAPLAGRDRGFCNIYRYKQISTHAPLAGRDWRGGAMVARHALFQPTRPLRGATATSATTFIFVIISTHAPLAGRDVALLRIALASL